MASILNNKGIEYLDLSGNLITDESLRRLRELQDLWFLDLKGTRVTREGIDRLIRDWPGKNPPTVKY